MSRYCTCIDPDEPCVYCQQRIDAAEDRRNDGGAERLPDWMYDAAAADYWAKMGGE